REVQDDPRVADAGEVPVAFDEAGRREPSREVDDARLRPDVGGDLLVGADGHDRVAARGERLRLRLLVVHGRDLALAEHERRGLDLGTALAGAEREDGEPEGEGGDLADDLPAPAEWVAHGSSLVRGPGAYQSVTNPPIPAEVGRPAARPVEGVRMYQYISDPGGMALSRGFGFSPRKR